MTAAVGPVSGTLFYIGPAGAAPASPDLWIAVGDINNLGDIAAQFAEIKVESIGSGDTFSLKGNRDYPNFALTMNRNDSDLGQIAIKTAAAATRGTLYPFKVVENDGGTAIWQGEVFGYGPAYGNTSAVRMIKSSVSIRPSTLVITLSV